MLDLTYMNSRKLLLPAVDQYHLYLVGCGGNGSHLAPAVAMVARLLMDKFQKRVGVFFVDPDVVEPKNCFRQNFCQAEVGRNKAETLAFRYGTAWGLDILAVPQAFKENLFHMEHHNRMNILIGCVDNPKARMEIRNAATHTYIDGALSWWLDCGNHKTAGQVLLGCGTKRPKDPLAMPGFCAWLPMPSERHPELVDTENLSPDPSPTRGGEEELSCADLAMLDSQGLAINSSVAAIAKDYLVRMLLTRDLQKCATYIDLESGSARSTYITEEVVQNRNN